MSTIANPLEPALMKLFQRAHVVYGLLHLMNEETTRLAKRIREAIASKQDEMPIILTGLSIPIIDLTGKTDHGWPLKYASGGFSVQDEQYVAALEALVSRNASWAVSQVYEAFETFLKDILAYYFMVNPSDAVPGKVAKFDGDQKSGGLAKNSFEYWRAYVGYVGHGTNNSGLFKLARALAPKLQQTEANKPLGIFLLDWYVAASKARHAVTHADFEVKPDEWNSMTEEQMLLSQQWFPCRMDDGRRLLDVSPDHAERAIRMFLQYAFTIFKFLSDVKGYDWNIFERGFKTGPSRP